MNKYELIAWLPLIFGGILYVAFLLYYKKIEVFAWLLLTINLAMISFLWFKFWFDKSLEKWNH